MQTTRRLDAHGAPRGATRAGAAVLVAIVLWFALAALLTVSGSLRAAPGDPPLVLLLAAALPVPAFLALYARAAPFRNWVLGLDLRLLVMLQAWRVIGGAFLVLLAYGMLPGLFAWPAGLGDAAIGASAPLVALTLIREPAFAARRGFLAWNLLGILDFIAALGTGVIASGSVMPGLSDVTTAIMTVWPLGLVPAFLVPLFSIMHLAAILQARRAGRAAAGATASA